jgi:hypothetical protein
MSPRRISTKVTFRSIGLPSAAAWKSIPALSSPTQYPNGRDPKRATQMVTIHKEAGNRAAFFESRSKSQSTKIATRQDAKEGDIMIPFQMLIPDR